MYRTIVAAKTRKVWRQIDAGDLDAAAALAHPDVHFRFVGSTGISGAHQGAEAFRAWFAATAAELPGLRFELRDVAVSGWPWCTRVAVRLGVSATLADGAAYENEAAQWITLRWGRMTDDWVLEDTQELQRALDVQATARAVEHAATFGLVDNGRQRPSVEAQPS